MSNHSYAHMVGNICLDKSLDLFGNPAPTTFGVSKVLNGHERWAKTTVWFSWGIPSLKAAQERLHELFVQEMDERGYELRIEGEPYYLPLNDGTDNFGYFPYQGESGWYDTVNNNAVDLESPANNKADYPLSDYPLSADEWITKELHSYSYDNYQVCIVTSAGTIVR